MKNISSLLFVLTLMLGSHAIVAETTDSTTSLNVRSTARIPLLHNKVDTPPKVLNDSQRTMTAHAAKVRSNVDFWIYDSWITFLKDIDGDGYFSSFDLHFDVDTNFLVADVYAVVYSSIDGENFDPFYTTDTFTILGDSTQDAISVENELVSGFAPNDYELLIVIYDAATDISLTSISALDDADLWPLSLESENHEYTPEPQVVIVNEHGGSIGWMSLLLLPLVVLYKRIFD